MKEVLYLKFLPQNSFYALGDCDPTFEPFAWAQPMHATKWERDIGSTSGSWRKSCTWNFHPKTAFMLWVTVAQLFYYTIFCLKHRADPKWLAWYAATTKCNLQGPAMSRKHQPMNLGYFISQIMQKARHPSYLIKSNLTITSLIHTLGFKASYIDQK